VLKYPTMFRAVDVLVLTKVDLIDYFDYSKERVKEDMSKLKPEAEILEISSKNQESILAFAEFLKHKKMSGFTSKHIF